MEESTFSFDALAEVDYDEDPNKALLGLDEWEVPESIYHEDGSIMSLWELASHNGYRFEEENDTFAGSTFDKAFVELGVDPVIGPSTQDHLELCSGLPTPIVTDEVTTQSTCANQPATVYPLDTLRSLENADLGPPLAVVHPTPATDTPISQVATTVTQGAPDIIEPAVQVPATDAAAAPATNVGTAVTQRAPGIIDPSTQVITATDVPISQVAITVTQGAPDIIEPAVQVLATDVAAAPATNVGTAVTQHAPGIIDPSTQVITAAATQCAPTTPDSTTSVRKVFTMSQTKPRSHPAKPLLKQKAKRVPKKQNDELHKIQKNTKAQNTTRMAKGKTTPTSVAPPLPNIAPASMTPAAEVTHNTTAYPSPQKLLQIQGRLQSQEQHLRAEWKQLGQQQANLKKQQPVDEQQLLIHRQQWQLHQQQFQLCHQKIEQHKEQVRRFRCYEQHQHATQQAHLFQNASTPQVQQPAQQMQADHTSPTKERMQSAMQQTEQLQASAAQHAHQGAQKMQSMMPQTPQVQQPAQQMQAVYSTPSKRRMQSVMPQTPQVQQPAQQIQAVYSTPSKRRMQSVMPQTPQVQQPAQQIQTVYSTPSKRRMQSVMQQTQQLQASAAQGVQQPQRMQDYSTPPEEPMQSVSSLSAASPSNRTFQFMENIVPVNFVANPNNHARWGVSPNGDRTYLNGSPAKKARVYSK